MKLAQLATEKKATNLTILNMEELVSYCDYFVLCDGGSRRQVRAIAQSILEEMKSSREQIALSIEGVDAARWVLLDYGDVIVHIFDESLREFYDLDGLWIDASKVEFEPPAHEE